MNISGASLCIIFVICTLSLNAQDQADKPVMKNYTFVMLKKGENRNHDSTQVAEIQRKHMEHMRHMAENGDLNVAGPFLDDGFWRGILIFNSEDVDKVQRLVEEDPAVKSGRLSYEIHPWMTQKGTTFK